MESPSWALQISKVPWSVSITLKSQIQALPAEKRARRKEGALVVLNPPSWIRTQHPPRHGGSPAPPASGQAPLPGTTLCSHHLESGALTAPSATSNRAIIGIFLRFYMRSFSIILCSISAQPGEGMYNLFCCLIELVVLSLLCQYKPWMQYFLVSFFLEISKFNLKFCIHK